MTARQGLAWDFVNEVAEGDVLAAPTRWAGEMIACSPMSLRATKEAAVFGRSLSDEQALKSAWDYSAVLAMLASDDAQEGPAAFMEKRRPVWQGR